MWGLAPGAVASPEDVATVGDDDRVVVRLDRLPTWLDPAVADDPAAIDGRYAAIRGVDLRRHVIGGDR